LVLRASLPGDGAPWRQDRGFAGGVTLDAGSGMNGPGLRAGDVVIAVDGVSLDRWLARSSPYRPPLAAGPALTYRVRRGGVLLVAALAHLALTFPSPPVFLARRGWLIGLLYGVGLAVNPGGLVVYLLAGHSSVSGLQRYLGASGVVLWMLVLLAWAGIGRTAVLAARTRTVRAQVRFVGLALGVTVL